MAHRRLSLAILAFLIVVSDCVAAPQIFWSPDRVGPGDVVLLYGGDLENVNSVLVWRLAEGMPGSPPAVAAVPPAKPSVVQALQASAASVKFQIPETFAPGVYGYQVLAGAEKGNIGILNRPEFWFLQPTRLQPGLTVNQASPGSEVQLIGKSFTAPGDTARPRLSLRPLAGGDAIPLSISKAEPFSLLAKLPDNLVAGKYELFAHPGRGAGVAWSAPLAIEVKAAAMWPDKKFNVREFGAKGDDVADDTKAIREALAAAAKNGGGIVEFPWGTYRLTESIVVPQKTILLGEQREATTLKWPLDAPKDEKDFLKAAIYIGANCGIENLTLTARRVEHLVLDVQYELNYAKSIPPEFAGRIVPWGRGGNIFLRKLTMHHLLLASRPEQQKPVMEIPALNKKYWEGLRNVYIHEGKNSEISDCSFEGGDQYFGNLENGRVVRNSFANHMGYSWTALGSGAIDTICEGNDIHASSSWGWGWIGLQRVYSAHNFTHNFVRGEREAMTLDISALPTARPAIQYWGSPIEVGNDKEKPFLKFPAADITNPDGFKTAWVPGAFKGGTVILRAFDGGAGIGQSRTILDNSGDTLFLDKSFNPAPDITPRKMYCEVAPRHHRGQQGTTAWLGTLSKSETTSFTAKGAKWIPMEFVGMTALILDGRGAGQYRVITSNSVEQTTLDRPWDVVPDETSVIGVWSLMRHMIVYDCKGTDTSAFAQMYGPFYDYIVDHCRVERTQGIWGQCGWFVQFRDNAVSFAQSYHPGIGMRGPNMEKNAPFGYTGLDNHRIRVTKSGAYQYPDRMMPLFADDVIGRPIPSTMGHIQRGNTLRYNQRMVVQPWTGETPPGPRPGGDFFRDVILDRNTIEHSAIGVQIGPNVDRVVLSRNTFRDVAKPIWLANPTKALNLGDGVAWEKLFASGDLTGWVEEHHDFFKKKYPDAKTWSVKDGIVSCDGSLGNCGFLRYDKKLADFVLRLECKMTKGCNSGVCIRVPKPYDGTDLTLASRNGYEVQIQDDSHQGPSLYTSGALYGAVAPELNAIKPAGQWNELEIVCRGTRICITLNGKIVQDVDQTTIGAIKERPRSGYLLLQNHGHGIEFRNLMLKVETFGK